MRTPVMSQVLQPTHKGRMESHYDLDMGQLIDLKVVRLVDWLQDGRPRGPVLLEIVLTNACNLHCGFCWKKKTKDDRSFSPDRAVKLVREAAALGTRWVRVTGGGEPFLHPKDALRVMGEVKRHGLFGTIITNGTRFDPKSVRRLVDIRWDEILISLDGATSRTHDILRGDRGAFAKSIGALRLFKEEKERQQSSLPVMKLQCVVTRQNCHELPDYVRLANQLSVGAIGFLILKELNPYVGHYRHTREQWETMRQKLVEAIGIARDCGIHVDADPQLLGEFPNGESASLPDDEGAARSTHSPLPFRWQAEVAADPPGEADLLCYEPFLSLTVQADGSLGPCCNWYARNYRTLGSGSLEDAWFSREFQELRTLFGTKRTHEYCWNCPAYRLADARDLSKRLHQLRGDAQHTHSYRERVASINQPWVPLQRGAVEKARKTCVTALVSVTSTLLSSMHQANKSMRTAALHVESKLIVLEDSLRQGVASHHLPPFVYRWDEIQSVLQKEHSRVVVANFEQRNLPDCSLGGEYPEGSVSTERIISPHSPALGKSRYRMRFGLPHGEHHGEVFVRVPPEAKDWRGFVMLNLRYMGSATGERLKVSFKDAVGQRWFSFHRGVLVGGWWHLLRLPLSYFHCPDEFQVDGLQHLEGVSEISFQISCSPESAETTGWIDLYEAFLSA